eukprot:6115622-Pyramimonas_sp.AAC.2
MQARTLAPLAWAAPPPDSLGLATLVPRMSFDPTLNTAAFAFTPGILPCAGAYKVTPSKRH